MSLKIYLILLLLLSFTSYGYMIYDDNFSITISPDIYIFNDSNYFMAVTIGFVMPYTIENVSAPITPPSGGGGGGGGALFGLLDGFVVDKIYIKQVGENLKEFKVYMVRSDNEIGEFHYIVNKEPETIILMTKENQEREYTFYALLGRLTKGDILKYYVVVKRGEKVFRTPSEGYKKMMWDYTPKNLWIEYQFRHLTKDEFIYLSFIPISNSLLHWFFLFFKRRKKKT